MAKPAELGAAFLDRVLAHLPEDARATVRDHIVGTPAAVEEIGRGTLRQEDYSRVRNEQTGWWTQNNAKLTDYDRLVAAGAIRPGADPGQPAQPAQPAQPVQPIDPNKRPITYEEVRAVEADTIGLTSIINEISMQHWHEFGEPLATTKIVQDAIKAGSNIRDYYASTVADRRATKAAETRAAEIKAAEDRGRLAGRQEALTQSKDMPYPVGTSAPTTLSGLRKDPDRPQEHSLDAAINTLIEETNRASARA